VTTSFKPDDLTQAFEILLGRPLSEFDADSTYAAFFLPTTECFCGYKHLTPENLTADQLPDEVLRDLDLYEVVRPHDLARSLFLFWNNGVEERRGVPFDVFESASLPCRDAHAVLTGRAVASLASSGVDLTVCDGSDNAGLYDIAVRIVSDGTLLDTMAAATGTRGDIVPRTFDDLEYAEGPKKKWAKRLSKVADPALREHLGTYCLNVDDARCDFWYYEKDSPTFGAFESVLDVTWKVVAGWENTDGPIMSIVVVQMPPGTEPGV
jgi:hypothetical protein